jgi:hypothetical protein
MIPEFSRKSCVIWKTTIFRFVWSGWSLILSQLWVQSTLLEGMGSHFFLPSLHPFPDFFLSNIVSRILQTFLNQMTLLVRALNPNSFSMNLFHLSLLLTTSCKKVSMFLKRMSFTIGRTCPHCLCQRLESHFEHLESSIHSPSMRSLRSVLE